MSEAAMPGADDGLGQRQRSSAGWLRFLDRLTYGSALGGALLMAGLLLLLLVVLAHGAYPAYQKFGLGFLTGTDWIAHPPQPDVGPAPPQQFGARTAIMGTMATSGIALLFSFPVSIGSAIFLVKLAPKFRILIPKMQEGHVRFRSYSLRHGVTVASFLIELLAAIPSIAYGLWGIFVVVPFMQKYVQPFIGHSLSHLPLIGGFFENEGTGYNIFTAGLILAIMVTPIMTAIIRDVLSVTPPELEQGALGLGATWWQATRLTLGFAKLGILGAVILGFARAVGETMAVTMVIGNSIDPDKSLLAPGQSIASLLAVQFRNADSEGEIHALVYAAFVLLVITTLINGVARVMIVRAARKSVKR